MSTLSVSGIVRGCANDDERYVLTFPFQCGEPRGRLAELRGKESVGAWRTTEETRDIDRIGA